jgi:copper chaperone
MIEFEIQAMTCGHCVAAITQTIVALDPNAKVLAELPTHRVRVETHLPRSTVEHALRAADYPPTPVL